MALVVKLTIPGQSLAEARENIERLQRLLLEATQAEADMFAILIEELEAKAATMRTRSIIRKRKRGIGP